MKERIRKGIETVQKWWSATGAPFVTGWWADLDEHPAFHFTSMMVGIMLLYAIKFAAWMIF